MLFDCAASYMYTVPFTVNSRQHETDFEHHIHGIVNNHSDYLTCLMINNGRHKQILLGILGTHTLSTSGITSPHSTRKGAFTLRTTSSDVVRMYAILISNVYDIHLSQPAWLHT
jgi:hypothetical protein